MNFDEYQRLAWVTMNTDLGKHDVITMLDWGLCGEGGEVVDLMKKIVFHKHPADLEKLTKEMGDVWWYIACACNVYQHRLSILLEHDSSIELMATRNIESRGSEREIVNRIKHYLKSFSPTAFKHLAVALTDLALHYKIDLGDVLEGNIAKLAVRYPEGFDTEDRDCVLS